MTTNTLPVAPPVSGALARLQDAIDSGMAPALAILLDEQLFERVQKIAEIMSKADGFVPAHCLGNTEVCFAIVTRSLVWRLDPFSVAPCTYQPVPGAKVAYEGKLIQAVLEQSGRLEGQITRTYKGDWNKVHGKFRMQKSEKGKMYAVQTYTDADEEGLSLIVSAQVKGEEDRREIELDLRQCHPRNSTLWATDPHTQIYYRAIRALGNVAMPGVLMGVPFLDDLDDGDSARARRARDVNPRPAGNGSQHEAPPPEAIVLVDPDGEERAFAPGEVPDIVTQWCSECTDEQLHVLVENNNHSVAIGMLKAAIERRHKQDDDPLKIAGLNEDDASQALGKVLRKASAKEADRLFALYRPRIDTFQKKYQDGLANIVSDRIAAEFTSALPGEGKDELPLT